MNLRSYVVAGSLVLSGISGLILLWRTHILPGLIHGAVNRIFGLAQRRNPTSPSWIKKTRMHYYNPEPGE